MQIMIFLVALFLFYLGYMLYFKEYVDVCKAFTMLEKMLNQRDLLLIKVLDEIKNKRLKTETINLIGKRVKARKSGYNEKVKIDVELNKKLKETYTEIDKLTSNLVIKEVFLKIVVLEKKLKVLREEYNDFVEKYNRNIIHHRKICILFLRMKPLDTYKKI